MTDESDEFPRATSHFDSNLERTNDGISFVYKLNLTCLEIDGG
jgi:hypothetical protein